MPQGVQMKKLDGANKPRLIQALSLSHSHLLNHREHLEKGRNSDTPTHFQIGFRDVPGANSLAGHTESGIPS